MSNVVVELDSVKKWRNNSEYTRIARVRCQEFDLEIVGYGEIIRQMSRLLAENNCDISRGYEVLRSGTLCFKVMPLDFWVNPPNRQPEHLRRLDV